VTIDKIDQYNMVTDQLPSFSCVTIFSNNMKQTLPPKVQAYRESYSYDIIIIIIIIIISSSSSSSSRSSITSILVQE